MCPPQYNADACVAALLSHGADPTMTCYACVTAILWFYPVVCPVVPSYGSILWSVLWFHPMVLSCGLSCGSILWSVLWFYPVVCPVVLSCGSILCFQSVLLSCSSILWFYPDLWLHPMVSSCGCVLWFYPALWLLPVILSCGSPPFQVTKRKISVGCFPQSYIRRIHFTDTHGVKGRE